MINFDELKIKDSELLGKEQWNGLLDDTQRYFEGNVGLGLMHRMPNYTLKDHRRTKY